MGDSSVLSGLTVVIGEKRIRAEIQEKEEAFATYDDAIRYVLLSITVNVFLLTHQVLKS